MPVHVPADLLGQRDLAGRGDRMAGQLGALPKQLQRLLTRQRRNCLELLIDVPHRLAAGRQDRQPRHRIKQIRDHGPRTGEHMLTVIH